MKELEVLKKIRETTEPLLRDEIKIADVVFRPFDMGCFGGQGYSLILFKEPNRMHGVRFADEPSESEIMKAAEMVQSILSPNGTKLTGAPHNERNEGNDD